MQSSGQRRETYGDTPQRRSTVRSVTPVTLPTLASCRKRRSARRLEGNNGWPNDALFLPCGALPQREQIVVKYKATLHGVLGQRIRASSLREGALFHAPTMHDSGKTIVSLDAARLVIKSVIGVALPGELLLGCPRLRPHSRILNGHDVFERRWPGPDSSRRGNQFAAAEAPAADRQVRSLG
jgi:hypothetical protein